MEQEKPIELTKEEYYTVFECLKKGYFTVETLADVITTFRNSTNEVVFQHYPPYGDLIDHKGINEQDTYYQVSFLLAEEQKSSEEMPKKITLNDPAQVQNFLNEISRLQREYYDDEKESENNEEIDVRKD